MNAINEKVVKSYSTRFGLALKMARVDRGIKTQADAADAIGVSQETMSRWESGASLPDLRKFVMLCELYNTSPNKLLYFTLEG